MPQTGARWVRAEREDAREEADLLAERVEDLRAELDETRLELIQAYRLIIYGGDSVS